MDSDCEKESKYVIIKERAVTTLNYIDGTSCYWVNVKLESILLKLLWSKTSKLCLRSCILFGIKQNNGHRRVYMSNFVQKRHIFLKSLLPRQCYWNLKNSVIHKKMMCLIDFDSLGVNVILWADFVLFYFLQKTTNPNCKNIKLLRKTYFYKTAARKMLVELTAGTFYRISVKG